MRVSGDQVDTCVIDPRALEPVLGKPIQDQALSKISGNPRVPRALLNLHSMPAAPANAKRAYDVALRSSGNGGMRLQSPGACPVDIGPRASYLLDSRQA